MTEIWKDIPEYEGYYKISNIGNIKAVTREIKNRWGRISVRQGMLKAPVQNGDGYFTIYLCKNGLRKKFFIHRLVAIAFISNIENKPDVNHLNGIKTHNHVDNLEWVTKSENTKHAYRMSLKIPMRGELNGRVKLTEEKVIEIKQRYNTGNVSYRILANEYNVDKALIARIIKGKSWPHVTLKTA